MSIFDKASRRLTDTVNLVQKKTTDTIALKKLETQIKTLQGEIDTLCTAIGKRVYAARMNNSQPSLDDLLEGIDALNKHIADIKEEIDNLNSVTRCENCGEELDEGMRFCPRCGFKVPENTQAEKEDVCPACGAPRTTDARFCDKCGHDYTSSDAVDGSVSDADDVEAGNISLDSQSEKIDDGNSIEQ